MASSMAVCVNAANWAGMLSHHGTSTPQLCPENPLKQHSHVRCELGYVKWIDEKRRAHFEVPILQLQRGVLGLKALESLKQRRNGLICRDKEDEAWYHCSSNECCEQRGALHGSLDCSQLCLSTHPY